MIKLAGAILILLSTTGVGFLYAGKIRKRYAELVYIKKIMVMLRGEINYNISDIAATFFNISKRVKMPYQELFETLSEKLEQGEEESFSNIWEEIVISGLKKDILKKQDLDKLKEFGENIGFLDKEMQMNYFSLFLENLESTILDMREQVKKDEKLYQVMGILTGLFFVIFLW